MGATEVELTLTRAGYCRKAAWFADRSTFSKELTFPGMIAVIRHPVLGTILFDTGYGIELEQSGDSDIRRYRRLMPFTLADRERLPQRLAQLGVARIDMIFLSHFHPDHIGGLREAPGAVPIVCSRDGLRRLRNQRGLARMRSAFFEQLLPDDFDSRVRAVEDFAHGDLAGDGSLVAVPLPGHAAGQYGLECRVSGGRRAFLCADAAWLRKANILEKRWPAWPVRLFVDDYAAFTKTLDWLHRYASEHPDVTIIPSHCEDSIREYGQ